MQGVINRVDFLEFARNQENRTLLRQLVELFNKYDLGGEEVSPDILGDAYEHILMKFAPQKAKEGEIYTPREVIRLMVEILEVRPIKSKKKSRPTKTKTKALGTLIVGSERTFKDSERASLDIFLPQ